MLQSLREKTSGWIAFVILGVVTIPFAFFGINNYFSAQAETYVAKVGDVEISTQQFRERLEQARNYARSQQGENFDASIYDSPLIKRQLLEQMIDEEVLAQAAVTAGAEVSDTRLSKQIAEVQAFHGPDGKFNPDQYQLVLTNQRMDVKSYEADVRRDLSLRELPVQISATALVSDAEIDRFLTLRDQTRDFSFVMVPRQAPETPATEEQIAAYYEAHKDEFMTEEQLALDYVELDASKMEAPTTVDDTTLRARYEEQKTRFVAPEQRLASHVLIKVEANADADAQKAAQDKASAIAAEARGGKDFAEIAKASSDDIGSKAQGGDLGWLEKGVTQPAFETALFALAQGAISDPVKTDEGFHVIQLREIKPEAVRSYEEVRADLETEYLQTERERIFTEISGAVIDQAIKDPDSIESAADASKLPVQKTALFGRAGGEGIAANPRVVRAAFSDAVLVDGQISDAIEIGPNHVVLIKVSEHKPREPRALEEVREQIAKKLDDDAAATRTETFAKEQQAKLAAGETLEAIAAALGGKVETSPGTGRSGLTADPVLVSKVFALPRPQEGASTRDLVELRRGEYALVELTKVTDGDAKSADAAAREAVRNQLLNQKQQVESRALLDALRASIATRIAEERM